MINLFGLIPQRFFHNVFFVVLLHLFIHLICVYFGVSSPLKSCRLVPLKVKTSFGNAHLSKNEMEALITNHVKEYVLTNT